MPKNEQTIKDGVGQLSFTFHLPQGDWKDETQETQGDKSAASIEPDPVRSKPERKRKWHSLIDKVYARPNLALAWEHVQANNGAAGSDGMTIARFSQDAERFLEELHVDLRDKHYRPGPVRRVFIPKSGSGTRPLGIPSVRDRIVQQALLQTLSPIFEPTFSSRSHGFRPGLGCSSALEVVDRAIAYGYSHVVDADIQCFFESVDHEKLLDAVNSEVADGRVLKLIRQILTAGVLMPSMNEVEPTSLGTPQGGPLSPLLANIYLDRLDKQLTAAGYGLVRYADDFVVFTKSEAEAHSALALCQHVLTAELGLVLHPEKTRIVPVDEGFEFLGFHFLRDPKTGLRCKEVRRRSVHRFRDAIRHRTPRLHSQRAVKARHVTLSRLRQNPRVCGMVDDLRAYLVGWHWYFKRVRPRYADVFESFDSFVRRRVRSAIVGRTGNGWWTNRITNSTLAQLGLPSLVAMQTAYRGGSITGTLSPGRAFLMESRMREIRTYGSGREGGG